MSKTNPLGLLVNYGDSDDSDDGMPVTKKTQASAKLPTSYATNNHASAAIHPPPISHCPWSACYDENSGFTYYWNQQTNAVTWEAPPEYLLALKLAQQQLNTAGSTEVSAEEWQLYQQALAEKQNAHKITKASPVKPAKKNDKTKDKKSKKRPSSDSEDEYKIELITSYHNSDSESNDEQETPKPQPPLPKPATQKPAIQKPTTQKPNTQKPATPKHQVKKQKTKPLEYGPSLPENQSYSAPIGPELPPDMIPEVPVKALEDKSESVVKEEEQKLTPKESTSKSDEDSQDESELLKKLKDKALILEKLVGELPSELKKIIKEDTSQTNSPKSVKDLDIDELLQEIEQKELPKAKTKSKVDMFDDNKSATNSPRCLTPSLDEKPNGSALFPSAVNIDESKQDIPPPPPPEKEKKKNIYLAEGVEMEKQETRKLRISKSVLPKKEKIEVPAYTTKYSQFIEGFSSERTGLGFKEDSEESAPKNAINYGNGLMFTKGEVLNEDKKDEALDDLSDLVEAKIKYLMQVQPAPLTPVQEMMVQMQTLVSAFRAGALTAPYWRRWVEGAAAALGAHERSAAPPGWHCTFQRSEGRYCYKREADGFVQWEYPAVASTDMEICTTPPPPDVVKECTPPPPASPARVLTPPPPAWHDPPPPGTDDPPPPPPDLKKEIGDELLSFYSDIAQLEKTSGPPTASNSPEPRDDKREKRDKWYKETERVPRVEKVEKQSEKDKSRKKSKVKISSSIGMKHKTVSSLVAKWQQVAEEINSD